jgi:hypothetical protein
MVQVIEQRPQYTGVSQLPKLSETALVTSNALWAKPKAGGGSREAHLQGVVDLKVNRLVLLGEGHGLLLKAGCLLVSGLLLLLSELQLQLELTAHTTSKQAAG